MLPPNKDSLSLQIGDVEPFSIVDFPEHISAVIFLKGCPWRCPFCYNTTLQSFEPEQNAEWTFQKVLAFLEKRKKVLDSVVFSGGEPLAQNDLYSAVKTVKNLGYHIGLHTGGFMPEQLKSVLELVDWVGFDIKAPFEEAHYQRAIGAKTPIDNIKQSLAYLLSSGVDFECRTTCDPNILTTSDLLKIGHYLSALGVKKYYLQKYRKVPTDCFSTEEQAENLVSNAKLNTELKSLFEVFDIRK